VNHQVVLLSLDRASIRLERLPVHGHAWPGNVTFGQTVGVA